MTTSVHRKVEGRIGTLTLDRPDRLNAMSAEMLREITAAAAWFDAQPEVRVVVVHGAGRVFSAGADLSLIAGMGERDNDDDPRTRADLGRQMADAVEGMRAVTVAAIHGWCVGGALVVAAACDLRVAADDTRFSIPEVDLGIPLAWGGIPRLVREIGPALTKELVMTGRPFDAVEAKAAGFVNRLVPAEHVLDEANNLAEQVAAKAWLSVSSTKTPCERSDRADGRHRSKLVGRRRVAGRHGRSRVPATTAELSGRPQLITPSSNGDPATPDCLAGCYAASVVMR